MACTDDNFGKDVQNHLDAPMPWIGMYIAAASLICSLAMAADAFHGFRSNKFWLPSNYFSLNATFLTFLAVSLKLPVDLTARMWAGIDRLAKVSSLILMSTAIGNFMPSLGSMNDKEILMNVTALGILVLTVIVNVCVQIVQMRRFLDRRIMFVEEIVALIFMFLQLVMLVSSAITVPTMKKYLKSKYREMLKMASDEEQVERKKLTIDQLRAMVKKYWVMAETSCPQFVIARSATCTASGVICLLIALVLAEALLRMLMVYKTFRRTASYYDSSTIGILLFHSIGVTLGTIAPALRWYTAINFKCSEEGKRSAFKDELKIEKYWTQMLVEWKESPLPWHIRDRKWRKLLHNTKRPILSFFVRVQILVVLASKLVRIISVFIMSPIISFFHNMGKLENASYSSGSRVQVSELGLNTEPDFSRYVLLLEGEVQLPQKTLQNICNQVDKVIQIGEMQQPKKLIKLIKLFGDFRGVSEFDSSKVPSLHVHEPPNCWSLPLVTLTSISIALPNISTRNANWLLSSVNEGLFFVKFIEKCLDSNRDLVNIRNAANVVWVGVELYRKWHDNDLKEMSLKGRKSKETLQELSNKAEKTVSEFKRDVKDFLMEDPLNWPVKVIAANSMYRICRTILLDLEDDCPLTDEGMFERLTVMIADILAACLTNLPRVITIKCHRNAINHGAKAVRQAALLLGESQEILQILQQHRTPSLDPDQAAYIEKWRTFREQEN
ncbi:unnamed protein product [Fraxinus pennsylvanica]|uniref:Uncharacterized protein n=1 Tax=Fraxinus pennsylvanica TaxID=56036 RepID=A0AAD1ZV05_9LAMI|nr:unnamed protein product [Fraxinus pennsylvanica]